MTQNEMNESWTPYTEIEIPDEPFGIGEIIQDSTGASVILYGIEKKMTIHFGIVDSLRVTGEGYRLRTYNEIPEVEEYYKRGYSGNPIFMVENSEFLEWLLLESGGYSFLSAHYLIITQDDIVDVATTLPPEITIENCLKNEE